MHDKSTIVFRNCSHYIVSSYYTISVGERVAENAVWSYEDPYPEIIGVKGYLAFYPDRVDEISVD